MDRGGREPDIPGALPMVVPTGHAHRMAFGYCRHPYIQLRARSSVSLRSCGSILRSKAGPFLASPEAGWQALKGVVQWSYKDFKPKDPIIVRYYMTQFPRLPREVDAFVDGFLKGLGPNESADIELGRLKQVLLATYGKEPEDDATKVFVSEQLWYEPHKDFSMVNLSEAQKAVLQKVDERIGK
jgi:hypothetical protein